MLDALAAIFRALLYGGVLSCAGAVFAVRTLRTPELAHLSTTLVWRSAWLAIAASVAGALTLIGRLGGEFDAPTLAAVLNSGFGAATAFQLVGAAMLLASLDDPTAQTMRLASALVMTLSFALSGHAAAVDLADGLLVFVHASAAAWWIGSLWLMRSACRQSSPAILANAVRRFSALAVIVVGVLVAAGVMLILVLLTFEKLPQLSPYEQTLGVKILIVACVLGVAAYNKFRLTAPLLRGDAGPIASLRKMLTIEMALIIVVLATTALLTTYTSPTE